MLGIEKFLEKFVKLGKSKKHTKGVLIETIKKTAGVEIKEEEIELSGEKARLRCPPASRNQIFMCRGQIEQSLKSQKIFLKIY